ncbi:Hypothetical protein, putative, partial [Bodo saltans]
MAAMIITPRSRFLLRFVSSSNHLPSPFRAQNATWAFPPYFLSCVSNNNNNFGIPQKQCAHILIVRGAHQQRWPSMMHRSTWIGSVQYSAFFSNLGTRLCSMPCIWFEFSEHFFDGWRFFFLTEKKFFTKTVLTKEETQSMSDITLEPQRLMGERFTLLKELGKGAFGEALLVIDKTTRRHMVVKRILPS